MADRFDQEFYRTEWRRVLPLGPDGIQPYVRTSRASGRSGLPAALGRLIATWGAMAQGMIAFGRFAASGVARRPMLMAPDRDRFASRPKRRAPLRAGRLRPTPVQGGLAPAIAARCAAPPERTETIERSRRHHRETREDYVASEIR